MQKDQSIPFFVRPEPIISRYNLSPQTRETRHRLTCKKEKESVSLHGHISSCPKSKSHLHQVNWIKYNMLVSIFDNWIRLAPFIQHLLEGKHEHQSKASSSIFFQKNNQAKPIFSGSEHLKDVFGLEVQNLVKRRRQMKQKSSMPTFISSDKDTITIRRLAELSKQIISSLPVESKNWTKAKIHKHNQIIDDCLQTYNQEEFNRNFDTIVNSLKERLRFIETMQTTFLNSCENEQKKLNQKIEMLKKPFNIIKKDGQKEYQERCEVLIKALEENKDPSQAKLKKKAAGRHTVYRLNLKDFSVVNDELKKNSTLNSTYCQEKSLFNQSHGMEKMNTFDSEERLPEANENQEKQSNDSTTSINLHKKDSMTADSGMKHSQSKIYNKDYFSNLLRGKFQRRQVKKQTSFTQNNDSSRLNAPKSSNMSQLSDSEAKLKKQANFIPSIDEIDEEELEHHFNKLKSYKKIGTMKFINGANKRGRVTKENLQQRSQLRESNFKPQKNPSKLVKTQRKKDFFQSRKGNLFKKGVYHKNFDIEASLQEFINWQGLDLLSKKEKLIQFLRTVQTRGWLKDQKYSELKERVSQLLNKCSPAVIDNNRKFAQQIEELSLLNDHQQHPKTYVTSQINMFLQNLKNQIENDSMIGLKIKNQLQMLFDPNINLKELDDSFGHQRYFLHSCELDFLKDQLRRINSFKEEEVRLSIGRQLLTAFGCLQQKQL